MAPKKRKDNKKKKGRKGAKEKVDPNKLNNVEKTFCQLEIKAITEKIMRLRDYIQTVDEANKNNKETLRELLEEPKDYAAELQALIDDGNKTINELEEHLAQVTSIRDEEFAEGTQAVKDLQEKYSAMRNQLIAELKILNGKLNALMEFRDQRQRVMTRFENQELLLEQREAEHQENMLELKRKGILDKEALKTEVEAKLLKVAKDITNSTDNSNIEYTRRLMRENIALKKEINTLEISEMEMMDYIAGHQKRQEELKKRLDELEVLKRNLIRQAQDKVYEIEKLSKSYRKLNTKHEKLINFKKMYEDKIKSNACELFEYDDIKNKIQNLYQEVERQKLEKNHLEMIQKRDLAEVYRLHTILNLCKDHIYYTIGVGKKHRQFDVLEETKGYDLLTSILNVLDTMPEDISEPSTAKTITPVSSNPFERYDVEFLPRPKQQLMDIFNYDPNKQTFKKEQYDNRLTLLQPVQSQILPATVIVSADKLVDLERGSSLYVSSEHERVEILQIEEEPLEDAEEEQSSSDDYQQEKIEETKSDAQNLEITQSTQQQQQKQQQVGDGQNLTEGAAAAIITEVDLTKNTSLIDVELEDEIEDEEGEEEEFIPEMFY